MEIVMTEGKVEPTRLMKIMAVVVNVIWVLSILSLVVAIFVTPVGLHMAVIRYHGFHDLKYLMFPDAYTFMAFGSLYVVNVLAAALILWIVHHLRLLMRQLKAGEPFHELNPGRIRKIAIGVIAWGPVRMIEFFSTGAMFFTGGRITTFGLMPHYSLLAFEVIFIGLSILIIAQIFEYGYKLQREQDLTV
jgi:hypothetical protein